MKTYTFGESYGIGPKGCEYVSFEIALSDEQDAILRAFLKENGDCGYGEIERYDRDLFELINDAANDAVLESLNKERRRQYRKLLDVTDVDWERMSFDFYWPEEFLED